MQLGTAQAIYGGVINRCNSSTNPLIATAQSHIMYHTASLRYLDSRPIIQPATGAASQAANKPVIRGQGSGLVRLGWLDRIVRDYLHYLYVDIFKNLKVLCLHFNFLPVSIHVSSDSILYYTILLTK